MLGLTGPRDKEPEVPLAELEALAAKGEDELLKFLKDETGRSAVAPVKRLLASKLDDLTAQPVPHGLPGRREALGAGQAVRRAGAARHVRLPGRHPPGSVFVTAGTDRRSSGTHYTPESLTEPIVQYTLEPLVYVGPPRGSQRTSGS